MEIVQQGTPVHPRSFSEISEALNKALVEIKTKKDVFDKATAAVTKASEEYQNSIQNAQFLRTELEKTLNDTMGEIPGTGRVRVSA